MNSIITSLLATHGVTEYQILELGEVTVVRVPADGLSFEAAMQLSVDLCQLEGHPTLERI